LSVLKALKGILNRQLFCLERPSDCSPELFAPRIDPVPTRGTLIDLTKEHSDVGRYHTHDFSVGTRHLAIVTDESASKTDSECGETRRPGPDGLAMAGEADVTAPLIGTEAHRWPVHLLPQATSSKTPISRREATRQRFDEAIAGANDE
jgi:hypothetical protein